jgi:predicted dithiol-disulfide oxidoreductase (DUF899 family)/uncharacterized protein YndB with AHSA1/START domain
MSTKSITGAFVVEREIRVEAPRERVFPLVATREGMLQWFRPAVFEPRPGGESKFVFPFDTGDVISRGSVTAYDPPARVAFTWAWQGGADDVHTEVTIDLIDEGGATIVRLTHTGFVDEAVAKGHETGWTHWLDRLEAVASGKAPGPDQHSAAEARRAARAALLKEEIALKDHVERVAAQRRALALPDPLDEDYPLAADDDTIVRFSELFGDKDDLLVYHLMFHPDDDEACPMCSLWVDGLNAVAPHVTERAAFAVIGKAPIGKLRAWAKRRGWNNVRVLSSYSTTFNRDMRAEDENGDQRPAISAYRRTAAGIHHFYQKHANLDDDNNRGIDLMSPVWNLFDLTPDGRGEYVPNNRHGA